MPIDPTFQRVSKLNQLADKLADEYLRRKSRVFLEMAVGDMLSTHSVDETIERLKDYIDQLEEVKPHSR